MENTLLNQISCTEYEIMERYRDWYAWDGNASANCKTIPIPDLLRLVWAKEKQNLYKLFGEKLIISKDFEYLKDEDELCDEFERLTDPYLKKTYGREQRNGYEFYKNYCAWIDKTYYIPSSTWVRSVGIVYDSPEEEEIAKRNTPIRDRLFDLICLNNLVHNTYNGAPFTISLEDGKEYTVNNGCKIMKVLSKIAESFDIPGFEDFRICHSLINNQKTVKGKINLSIHPLDYWTMSDNDCGWESCMNWRDTGGYRLGTVEMMNSPSVIVAYISASENMNIGNSYHWNNKKWRQLFIVDKEVILGIKSYPYYNESITFTVIKWLKELAEQNMGWTYFGNEDNNDPLKFSTNNRVFHNPNFPDELPIKFNFSSDAMYTDVGCMSYHPLYIGKSIRPSEYKKGNKSFDYDSSQEVYYIDYNYSGLAQCVSCGSVDNGFETEADVCCNDCQASNSCCECGSHVYEEDGYTHNGFLYCYDCWNDLMAMCPVCNNYNYKDNMFEYTPYIDYNPKWNEYFTNNYYSCDAPEGYKAICIFNKPFYVDSDHEETFFKKFVKDMNDAEKLEVYSSSILWSSYFDGIPCSNIDFTGIVWEDIYPHYGMLEYINEGDYDKLMEEFHWYFRVKFVRIKDN